jgi:hypothetical protein
VSMKSASRRTRVHPATLDQIVRSCARRNDGALSIAPAA